MVVVYDNSGGSWQQLGDAFYGDESEDLMGFSVALSADGNRLAIGAYQNDDGAEDAGQVRVYEYSSGSWNQLGADHNGVADYDYVGYSVSLSSDGSKLAFGAPYALAGGVQCGVARVYEYSSGSWTQVGGDMAGDGDEDYVGNSVQLSSDGNRIVVGVPYTSPNGAYSGAIRVYELTSGSWVKLGSDINGQAANDYAGYEVAISADGTRVAASIPLDQGIGRVRVYDLDNGAWTQVGDDLNGESTDGYMGHGLGLSTDGSRLIASEPWNSVAGEYRGRVFVYDLGDDGAWSTPTTFDGVANSDDMGYDVAISRDGMHMVMGAPYHDAAAEDAGRIYVYDMSVPTTTAAPTPAPTEPAEPNETPSGAVAHGSNIFIQCILAAFVLALFNH